VCCRCVTEPGSWVALSVEQSDKTAAAAAMVACASVAGLPSVMIVKDLYAATREVEGKMRELLNGFDKIGHRITPHFLAGGMRQWAEWETPEHAESFKRCEGMAKHCFLVLTILRITFFTLRCLNAVAGVA